MAVTVTTREQLRQHLALDGYDYVQYFNPYKIHHDGMDVFVKGIPFVFMTSPMLNLTKENIASDSFLAYLFGSSIEDPNRHILKNLTYTAKGYVNGYEKKEAYVDSSVSGLLGSCSNRFIPIITNTALSIDLKDTVSRTKEVGETFYGYKQVHPGSLVDSIVGDEISIKYLELSNLPIIKTHKAWQAYIEKIRRGTILPSEKAIELGFIDYMASIYYFLCDFDGETIKYWAKYTGVTPLNVPYSSLGGELNSHEIPDVTINYLYCYKEDMTLGVLRDFNRLANADNDLKLEWGEESHVKTEEIPPSGTASAKKTPLEIAAEKQKLTGLDKWKWHPCIYREKLKDKNYYVYKLKFSDITGTPDLISEEYPYKFDKKDINYKYFSDIKSEEYPYKFGNNDIDYKYF